MPFSWPEISSDISVLRTRPGRQKWSDCSTNDIRSWPFLSRQISCLEPVSARDMQIALIYTEPGDCCLVRLVTASQIRGGLGPPDVPEHRLPRFASCESYSATRRPAVCGGRSASSNKTIREIRSLRRYSFRI